MKEVRRYELGLGLKNTNLAKGALLFKKRTSLFSYIKKKKKKRLALFGKVPVPIKLGRVDLSKIITGTGTGCKYVQPYLVIEYLILCFSFQQIIIGHH